jgi:hypothetical protein
VRGSLAALDNHVSHKNGKVRVGEAQQAVRCERAAGSERGVCERAPRARDTRSRTARRRR